ncbi:uncharacterized protein LOC107795333 isoform X2 [Nicotiana tabacum]|uniref:Uncharacterized protein LOC107795333 isoform X2 n=2 Tax=Nicotiana TaxID=4085 RepID=A0A1S4A9X0_TOBAC|nr:PREDICTED: uncharacterized protein LOC104210822 isoform X2 [Nicotiana sylvestris]XP_016473435.1 PREDICTED: uncharacterized protein LOC107795333 isoform X2 [Nicotiana tabacum]
MIQQKNQDLASSLPALPRLDRLDRLLLEEKHGLSGRHSPYKKEEVQLEDQCKTLTLSSALEQVHHKGTLMERLSVVETRLLQLSQISLYMDEGKLSRSSSSTGVLSSSEKSGHTSVTSTVLTGQDEDEKANLHEKIKNSLAVAVEEKCLSIEGYLTEKTEQSTNMSRIKRRKSHRKWPGWLRLLGC